jgi:pimeloyl-ACP methyl ester carboxylesterase
MPVSPARPIGNGNGTHRSLLRRFILSSGIAAGFCLLPLLSLATWNLAVAKWQHVRNPVPGSFYSVGGYKMHIYCSGVGSPMVVVEAGLGSNWLGWQGVQPQLSRLTRFCTYDRSGLGWSEPRPGHRDAENIVRQLHTLLDEAGVQRPFVFVGHSAGGLYAREYVREYPAEVIGVALIDSASPHQIDNLPGFRASYDADRRNATYDLMWEKLRVWSGWERLTGHCRARVPQDVAVMAGQYNAQQCRPEYVGGDLGEFMDLETAMKQASRLTTFGNIPLLILSQDTNRNTGGMKPIQIADLPVWAREQRALMSLSPLSWHVIARGSAHEIYHDRPDVVVAEISRLILYLRGGPSPPFGSTMTE